MPRKKSEPAVEAQQITNDPLDSIEQKATAPPIVEERRATRAYSEDILDITDQERGFTPEDTEDVKWNYLRGAMHRHLVLTGVVSGIENTEGANPIVVVNYEGIRILIPS